MLKHVCGREAAMMTRQRGGITSSMVLHMKNQEEMKKTTSRVMGYADDKKEGPTSFAPIIRTSIDVVKRSNWQYHVLVIIADGQVTRNPDVPPGKLSSQEDATIKAIVDASYFPLSIIMVGVGDGPWDAMEHFDDCIPERKFDNFQVTLVSNDHCAI
ncbi:hypothetical protein ZIOFF_028202 [Zingiber officinale]|uniref:Copine C-terminal domain-containing protein n=1 Tax=Zingiber officinale TaxID=94328 RepID=A0A8J5LER0_ZINOF|nr:hypothetical protein ZIOFF_028202 [Zingiber officinale]